jgi:hypothetical protein
MPAIERTVSAITEAGRDELVICLTELTSEPSWPSLLGDRAARRSASPAPGGIVLGGKGGDGVRAGADVVLQGTQTAILPSRPPQTEYREIQPGRKEAKVPCLS